MTQGHHYALTQARFSHHRQRVPGTAYETRQQEHAPEKVTQATTPLTDRDTTAQACVPPTPGHVSGSLHNYDSALIFTETLSKARKGLFPL